jgi:hypothetical protein
MSDPFILSFKESVDLIINSQLQDNHKIELLEGLLRTLPIQCEGKCHGSHYGPFIPVNYIELTRNNICCPMIKYEINKIKQKAHKLQLKQTFNECFSGHVLCYIKIKKNGSKLHYYINDNLNLYILPKGIIKPIFLGRGHAIAQDFNQYLTLISTVYKIFYTDIADLVVSYYDSHIFKDPREKLLIIT